ncbi:MAG TPA: glycine cleavage system aminomethyltransferase GcvT, partial [Verrucomicrobiae bacterium]
MALKRTPLFEAHQRAGGKLIEFGGWEMPVQYTSITDEHLTVRNAAGIFDISHMGEVLVSGAGAAGFLNRTLTNDIRKLTVGMGQYTLMCNAEGGVIDDLYVYRIGENEYLLVINASRIDPDVLWLEGELAASEFNQNTTLKNVSDSMGAVAVQGPKVVSFIDGVVSPAAAKPKPSELKKNQVRSGVFEEPNVWIGRTGYTGEDGFEIIAPAELIEGIWNTIFELGKPAGIKPAGLGARDTLRTEVCYPLYGHELDEQTTPIEAGLPRFVSFDKGEFTGRKKLLEQKERGVNKTLVAFKMTDKSAPPRPHYPIWSADGSQQIGEVVSGTQSPS